MNQSVDPVPSVVLDGKDGPKSSNLAHGAQQAASTCGLAGHRFLAVALVFMGCHGIHGGYIGGIGCGYTIAEGS